MLSSTLHRQDRGLAAAYRDELLGKESGVCKGIGSSQHLFRPGFISNGPQGALLPVGTGIARQSQTVEMSSFRFSARALWARELLTRRLIWPRYFLFRRSSFAKTNSIPRRRLKTRTPRGRLLIVSAHSASRPFAPTVGISSICDEPAKPQSLGLAVGGDLRRSRSPPTASKLIRRAMTAVTTMRLNFSRRATSLRAPLSTARAR